MSTKEGIDRLPGNNTNATEDSLMMTQSDMDTMAQFRNGIKSTRLAEKSSILDGTEVASQKPAEVEKFDESTIETKEHPRKSCKQSQVVKGQSTPKSSSKPLAATIIKLDEPGENTEGKSEKEQLERKRANSFIRDGYEIYYEGTYLVNGKRKKKIKKRKLSKQ